VPEAAPTDASAPASLVVMFGAEGLRLMLGMLLRDETLPSETQELADVSTESLRFRAPEVWLLSERALLFLQVQTMHIHPSKSERGAVVLAAVSALSKCRLGRLRVGCCASGRCCSCTLKQKPGRQTCVCHYGGVHVLQSLC
jgi:hypothetical protein